MKERNLAPTGRALRATYLQRAILNLQGTASETLKQEPDETVDSYVKKIRILESRRTHHRCAYFRL